MGSIRKITFHRTAERKNLSFYVSVIIFSAVVLASLSFVPQDFMVFGWGVFLLIPTVAYPLLSAVPRGKATAFAAFASIVCAIVFSCYYAPRRSLNENVFWMFVAVAALLVIQVAGRADLSERLNAIVAAVPLAAAAHLGILWLLVPRDVFMDSYVLRVAVIMVCGALILLMPFAQRAPFFTVVLVTIIGFVAFNYNFRQTKPLAALCIGFTCGVILVAGSRYVGLFTKKKPLERSEGILVRKRYGIRVQVITGFAATIAIGVMSYFFGAVFIL